MSAAKSGYIAPSANGGDDQVHATKLKLTVARQHESYCDRVDSDDLITPVAIFMPFAFYPLCVPCVEGIESEQRVKGRRDERC